MFKTVPRLLVLCLLGMTLVGCGQSPPPRQLADAATDQAKLTPTADHVADSDRTPPVASAPKISAVSNTGPDATSYPDAVFLADGVVGLIVAHPRRLTEWPLYAMAKDAGLLRELEQQTSALGFKLEEIERVTLVINQAAVNAVAKTVGLDVPEVNAGQDSAPPQIPILIVSLVNAADRSAIVKSLLTDAEEETAEGQTLQKNETSAVWFVDDKTVVCGPIDSVKKMIVTRQSGQSRPPAILSQLEVGADLTMSFDLEPQSALLQQAAQSNPALALIQQINSLALQINVTGQPGSKLIEFVATAAEEQSAATLSQFAMFTLEQQKQNVKQFRLPPTASQDELATHEIMQSIVKSAVIQQSGARLEFFALIPEGFDTLPQLLKSTMEKARTAAESTKKRNNLIQIALAFHSYHDTNGSFPGAGRSAAGKQGLSWRVHLLPFLDQAALYNEFNLDEPWDSEHNKPLIARMPAIFNSEGTTEAGKTSIHVFTGPGAPFAQDQAPTIATITDGTSTVILLVEAGAETAEIWTKPGGLDFDPEDPLKALGELPGEVINLLTCDGAFRAIPKTIKADVLRRMIQSQDGEPVEF